MAWNCFVICLKEDWLANTVTYNTLIQGFFQAGDCEMPNKFSNRWFLGVPPDIWTYNILLDGLWLCKAGKVEDAWKLFVASVKGVKPDVVTYTTMISGFCRKV
ncbi:unnamed protein product [Microthlaspi erraticum]|uniref:Pentatricopeptide repeat-containing protein n=1 Tax=Microthlaspi erraticum TaxID=1685480 RepID=A0A6D2K3B8_9BRAS|nr:unnamed protein product [Microthlaspi erraticum]